MVDLLGLQSIKEVEQKECHGMRAWKLWTDRVPRMAIPCPNHYAVPTPT